MYRIRDWLYIGKWSETQDLRLLQQVGIGAMLQLAGPVEQPNIISLYLPVEDGAPLPSSFIQQGLDFLQTHIAAQRRVLTACSAGISRSTTFAIAVLVAQEALSPWDAYRAILEHHPAALPNPHLFRSLLKFYDIDTPYEVVYRELLRVQREQS